MTGAKPFKNDRNAFEKPLDKLHVLLYNTNQIDGEENETHRKEKKFSPKGSPGKSEPPGKRRSTDFLGKDRKRSKGFKTYEQERDHRKDKRRKKSQDRATGSLTG